MSVHLSGELTQSVSLNFKTGVMETASFTQTAHCLYRAPVFFFFFPFLEFFFSCCQCVSVGYLVIFCCLKVQFIFHKRSPVCTCFEQSAVYQKKKACFSHQMLTNIMHTEVLQTCVLCFVNYH